MLASVVQMSLFLTAATPDITPRELAFGCDDRLALVEKVKTLDHAYLSELAAYAASDQCARLSCRPPLLDRLAGLGNRTPVFERLPHSARIKLSVCMDEGVMLIFTDIGTPRAVIVVSTSEDDIRWDSTQIWSAGDANGGT
jgi:hypothetical protein